MDRLAALPVKGESFLLYREDRYILVDGGYNSKSLARALKKYDPHMQTIDIVVCTHADRDHAGGLAGLMKNSGLAIKEFWLPGKWLDSIEDLLLSPNKVANGLIKELDVFAKRKDILENDEGSDELSKVLDKQAIIERRKGRFEQIRSNYSEEHVNKEQGKGRFEQIRSNYSDSKVSAAHARSSFKRARQKIKSRLKTNDVPAALGNYWLDLIETAKNIRDIAEEAINSDVPVRWFDFDAFSQSRIADGGIPGLLVPLNAIESEPPPNLNISYLAMLSAVNEECLAFFAPPFIDRLGVVFCGDSPMGDGTGYRNTFLKPSISFSDFFPIVATAPHHGSESNAIAYSHVSNWVEVIIWLRTGGSSKHPGVTYKSIPHIQRTCTNCPNSGKKLGLAEVYLHLGKYSLLYFYPIIGIISPHRCNC